MTDWSDVDGYDLASDAVKDCAESVKADNPDMDKQTAFAICQDLENQGKLADAHEHAGNAQPFRALATDHPMDPPGTVERREQDDGSIRYTNLLLLGPGEWTDAATGETIFYAPDLMETIAGNPEERVVRDRVNLNHESQDQLLQVGHFDDDTLQTDAHGNLYGDVVLHGRTTASEDAIGLMDLALETEGAQGAGGLSVEIPFENEVIEFDKERGMDAMVAGDLSGLAIVTDAASAPAAMQEQLGERAVAMSRSGESVRALSRGQTALTGDRPDSRMEIDDADDLETALAAAADDESNVEIEITADNVADVKDAITTPDEDEEEEEDEAPEQGLGEDEEPEREMQDFAVAQDVAERARQEGFDPSANTVADLVEFVNQNLEAGDEELQALEDAVNAFLQAAEAEDPSAESAEGLMDFLAEQAGSEDGDDETEEELAAIQEELRELREDKEDLQSRVEELEDEPAPKREFGGESEEETVAVDAAVPSKGGGFSRDGDYYGR